MQNKALFVEYSGTNYHGWQSQKSGIASVQSELEMALSKVASMPVSVVCAGRTDAGVHALSQVVSCQLPGNYSDSAWILGVNSNLPKDIRVFAQYDVSDEFNARYSANSRYYSYVIYNNRVRPGLFSDKVSWCYKKIDIKKMQTAAKMLLGEHDFSSFRASDCQSRSTYRNIKYINVRAYGKDYVVLDIEANAFLHNMVRNIVGTLLDVATNEKVSETRMLDILAAKDRKAAGHTAAATGLYFSGVRYPKSFNLPFIANQAWFFESESELV
jgi:tRNA pseudouridine38-40 synthase